MQGQNIFFKNRFDDIKNLLMQAKIKIYAHNVSTPSGQDISQFEVTHQPLVVGDVVGFQSEVQSLGMREGRKVWVGRMGNPP